ncbi:MAG: helix-turn-helix transcriptional regulator [Oscillospiraceae bacterium]|nr:helix-turn-helix transcriptional regulator [Oscillospiraceae bacterium]
MQNHLYLYPNLVRVRKERCSQAELAEHLGITQQEISRYERGEIKAPVNYIADVAEYCGVSVDYILGRSTEDRSLLTAEESALLHLYQALNEVNRIRLYERAESLLSVQNEHT